MNDLLGAILAKAGATPAGDPFATFAQFKSKSGRQSVATSLGLTEADLSALDAALSDVRRWADATGPRAAELQTLSVLTALERLEPAALHLGVTPPSPDAPDVDTTTATVRALELVLRELVQESHRTQDALTQRLISLFPPAFIERWRKAAGGGELLSGLSFGELASLFVSREEYPRYQPLLEVGEYLAMIRERRKTLRLYLDGARRVRNALAHHRTPTALQRAMVAAYAREIFTPLTQSWRDGKTQVNPEVFVSTEASSLRDWVATLADDVREVQDELSALTARVSETERTVSALEGGLVLLLVAAGFFALVMVSSAYTALFDPVPPTNLQRLAVLGIRSLRGVGWSVLTFCFAATRVALNLFVFRQGKASGLRAWLTSRRPLVPLAAWTVAGVVFMFTPGHVDAIERPLIELDSQSAFLMLDEEAVDRYLANGGNPNAVINGNSVIHLTLTGLSLNVPGMPGAHDGGPKFDEEKRGRILKKLIAAGAKVTDDDRKFAKVMEREHLLP
ncbi:MAG: STY4199 family HEPN domain-containing protein [Myxococcaceae bacterium]